MEKYLVIDEFEVAYIIDEINDAYKKAFEDGILTIYRFHNGTFQELTGTTQTAAIWANVQTFVDEEE